MPPDHVVRQAAKGGCRMSSAAAAACGVVQDLGGDRHAFAGVERAGG